MAMSKERRQEKEIARLRAELDEQLLKNAELQKRLSSNDSVADHATVGWKKTSYTSSAQKGLNRGTLLSCVSHELLTPMDAILGMTELVLNTELNDDQREYLEMINASAYRLFGVVSDVIDFSELAEKKLRCDMVNFDIYEELEYDLYVAKLSARHKELQFSTTFSQDIPGFLNSDPARLRQVLNSLVNTVIYFTDEGEVALKVDCDGHDERGRLLLKFTIKGTGRGIPDELRRTLFDLPMKIGIGDGDDKYSGGGLGLALAARLVELFGGEIGVTSGQGKGMAFWFTWPVANPVEMYMGELPPDMFSNVQDRSLVLRGARILLAEDEGINASVTRAFLEQAGMQVDLAANGWEAVEAMKKNRYNAVLMDVQMPGLDGLEATTRIRKIERKKKSRCPVIALTAHALGGDREQCLQAGMDDYLAKPLDKTQLLEMLARYMTKKALVVGSDPEIKQDVIDPLVHGGWAVVIAETGRMGMYEASLAHFDLIVIDSSLPVADGLEMVNTVRRLEQFSGCRAMILAVGFAGEEEYADYGDSGIDEFYLQPMVAQQFRQRVEQFR